MIFCEILLFYIYVLKLKSTMSGIGSLLNVGRGQKQIPAYTIERLWVPITYYDYL